MNTTTDDPMFFNPIDFFDEESTISHSNGTIPPLPSHHDSKLQCPEYPSTATEWSFQYPLDPISSRNYNDPLLVPGQPRFIQKQPSIAESSFDLNQHFAEIHSSTGYMDTNKPSWMIDALDNTYLPDFGQSSGLYEEYQNGENPFHSNQQHPNVSQEMPSHFMPSSYSQYNIADLFDCPSLPDEYANFTCIESFPNLPHSIINHESFNVEQGREMQSFLGYMPRKTSPHNTSKVLSNSHTDPQLSYIYPDANEGMDDLSDSDTTTSAQSWMMPFPQDPFSSGRQDDLSTSTFQPIGGMVSSISTPDFSFDHSQLQHSSHSVPTVGKLPIESRSKKRSKTSSNHKQRQGKPNRSNSSHTIGTSNNHNSVTNRKPPQSSQQPCMQKRYRAKRRQSEPYLLNTVHANNSVSTSPVTNHHYGVACFSPPSKSLPASESIASLLSRQRLSDNEDDEMGHGQSMRHGATIHHRAQRKESKHMTKVRGYFAEEDLYHKDSSSDDNEANGRSNMPPPPPTHANKKGRNVDKACNHCKRSHLRCDSMRPCRRCIATGKSGCQDVEHKPRGRPRLHGPL
ncbi:unnamed protein product [Absidia cylindrospora]